MKKIRNPLRLPTRPLSKAERNAVALAAVKTLRVLQAWDDLDVHVQEHLRSDLGNIQENCMHVDLDEILCCPKQDRARMAAVILDRLSGIIESAGRDDDAVLQEMLAHGSDIMRSRYGVDPGRVVWTEDGKA